MRDAVESSDTTDAAAWLTAARAGDLETAWSLSDRIRERTIPFGDAAVARHLQQIWTGESPANRRVLVRCYHGLGDTIQFARYLPRLRDAARSVTVWAQPALIPLLNTIPADIDYLPLHDGVVEVPFDVDVEIMELAYLFRSTLETIPADVPYLTVARRELGPSSRPRVGLVWRAGEWNPQRSIPFAQLRPLLDDAAIDWHSLQLGARRDEQHWNLLPTLPATALETATHMRALDLVVSVDSMPAHLAGALGVPIWTLVPRPADWRWLVDRPDSPWYPTMRLFRQDEPGDWSGVIDRLRQAIHNRFAVTGSDRTAWQRVRVE